VTLESFKAWKLKFDREVAQKKAQEEEEKLKAATPKEREEYRRYGTRLSGKLSHNFCWSRPDGTNIFRKTTVRTKQTP
jgi:hypothetical protein